MVHERQFSQALDDPLEAPARREEVCLAVAIQTGHRILVAETVGEAGGVGEEVGYRDRCSCRLGGHVIPVTADVHPHVFERRDVLAERIVEMKGAFLVEHHRRDRRNRFGHRVEAKQPVLVEPHLRLRIAVTDCFEIGHLSASRDESERTG